MNIAQCLWYFWNPQTKSHSKTTHRILTLTKMQICPTVVNISQWPYTQRNWASISSQWQTVLIHFLEMSKPLKSSLPDDAGKLRLFRFCTNVFVPNEVGPFDLQDFSLTSHVKGIQPFLITVFQCPALSTVCESRQDTSIVELHLCWKIYGSILPNCVQLSKYSSCLSESMIKFLSICPFSTTVSTQVLEMLNHFDN